MRRLVLLILALLVSSTAQAGQRLCFKLADPSNPALGYSLYMLLIQPPCQVTGSEQAPMVSSVNGIQHGFDADGHTTENFLLVGTCEADAEVVNLEAEAVGSGPYLQIYGPSIATGTWDSGPFSGPAEPVSCQDLSH